MSKNQINHEELAALEVLCHTGVNVLDAAIVAKTALESITRRGKSIFEE